VTADPTIRPLTAGFALDQYWDLTVRSFGPQDESRLRATVEPIMADGRCLGAFDGDRLIGSALFHDMRQWWHGRPVPLAGVAGVKIAPEDRGRGVGRALMAALVDLMAERGYPLSALYPATMAIYRSLGWEIAGHRHEAVLPARSLFALVKPDINPEARGATAATAAAEVRRPGPDDAAEVLDVIGRAHALAHDCGPITFDEATMRRWLVRPGRYADDDRYAYLTKDGFLGYRWLHGHDEIFVDRVVAASAEATRVLWGLVASNSSVADTVRAQVGPTDPVRWLLREQDTNIAERLSWMLRLLDAPAAIAARGFPATDIAVPLHITDDLRPANSGRWELTVRAGAGSLSPSRTSQGTRPGHTATPTPPGHAATPTPPGHAAGPTPAGPGDQAPLALGPRGLAALYAGTPVATLRRAGLAAGGTPAADAALDGAFAATPFMLDDF
jgi:predicted acetyltransferase